MLRENEVKGFSGWAMVILLLGASIGAALMLISAVNTGDVLKIVVWLMATAVLIGCWFGLTIVNPNEAKVVQLLGSYQGTLKTQGLRWVNPLTLRRKVSLRVRNFESGKLKVNDHDGNPIDIAAVVVWRVVETAEAVLHVDDYEHFVHVQSEAALRNLATSYPYNARVDGQMCLRMSAGEIAHKLREEIQERLAQAGVEVIEARISHLAYASEIASAMLSGNRPARLSRHGKRLSKGPSAWSKWRSIC